MTLEILPLEVTTPIYDWQKNIEEGYHQNRYVNYVVLNLVKINTSFHFLFKTIYICVMKKSSNRLWKTKVWKTILELIFHGYFYGFILFYWIVARIVLIFQESHDAILFSRFIIQKYYNRVIVSLTMYVFLCMHVCEHMCKCICIWVNAFRYDIEIDIWWVHFYFVKRRVSCFYTTVYGSLLGKNICIQKKRR